MRRGSKQICQEAGLDSGWVWPPAGILKHSLFHSVSRSVARTAGNYYPLCLPLFEDIFFDPETSLPRCPDSHVVPQYWGTSSQFVLTKLTSWAPMQKNRPCSNWRILGRCPCCGAERYHHDLNDTNPGRRPAGLDHDFERAPLEVAVLSGVRQAKKANELQNQKKEYMVQCCHNTVHSHWMSLDVTGVT